MARTFEVIQVNSMDEVPSWANRDEFSQRSFDEYRECIVIRRGDSIEYFWDGGEPEDQYYSRRWSWVSPALIDAYEAGRRDALAEKASG